MSQETNPLPADMWIAPEKVVSDPALQLLHSQLVARLREEMPDADTLLLMQIERVVTLYCYTRQKEIKGTFAHDRSHKETVQLWAQMVSDVRKFKKSDLEVESAVTEAIASVAQNIASTIQSLPVPDETKVQIMNGLSSALDD